MGLVRGAGEQDAIRRSSVEGRTNTVQPNTAMTADKAATRSAKAMDTSPKSTSK